ncbi:MAG: Amino-acid carrier protein AlsT [Chlamydiia bacterium]|nr:Amino-acid carrier protein AlsT [Chlamydiia bacterium]MCH9615388.1 Amino-acid carrier protein AlsT [Chlamydiia bacterium]MCH9628290.1 Amino-acid carrier protein AlsT [Chlamydiia bacterium]
MDTIQNFIEVLRGYIWSPPLLIFLVAAGVYLTIRTKGVQFRYLWYAHKIAFKRHDDDAQGDVSHFQALMTALAATIGIGSISGIATAIATGGLGALFWMWIAALFGMATKYGEAILAIKYRVADEKGEMCGGPMYYLSRGINSKFLAGAFAIFAAITALGTGNLVQSNSVSSALLDLFNVPPVWSGLGLMIAVGFALIGGIKSIGRIAGLLVPTMALFYLVGGLAIMVIRYEQVPAAFALIFHSAFNGQAAAGGFLGASVMLAVRMGISRGVFSSEAGLGSSPIAAAAAKTDTPGRQALVSMCSVFITTGIVCTITGVAIAVSGVLGTMGANGKLLDGSALALRAFDSVIPYGGLIVTIALIPFAYSTILGWAYYGEKSVEYLFGIKAVKIYRLVATLIVFPGAIVSLELAWGISDVMNGLMAFPNLVGLFAMGGIISKETRAFDKIVSHEKKARAVKS